MGGLVYQGNQYIGGISYNGRFWNKMDAFFNLARLSQTDILRMDAYLQKDMPMFHNAVLRQLKAALKKEKCLDDQIKGAAKDRSHNNTKKNRNEPFKETGISKS